MVQYFDTVQDEKLNMINVNKSFSSPAVAFTGEEVFSISEKNKLKFAKVLIKPVASGDYISLGLKVNGVDMGTLQRDKLGTASYSSGGTNTIYDIDEINSNVFMKYNSTTYETTIILTFDSWADSFELYCDGTSNADGFSAKGIVIYATKG